MTDDALQIGLSSLVGLLGEFAKGNIVDPRAEREGMNEHAGRLSQRWDQTFPGFPDESFPFTSFRGEYHRGKRDAIVG